MELVKDWLSDWVWCNSVILFEVQILEHQMCAASLYQINVVLVHVTYC